MLRAITSSADVMPQRLRRMTSEAQHSTAQPLSSKSETHAADLQSGGGLGIASHDQLSSIANPKIRRIRLD
ncbi:hypothetical protein LA080_002816 [Diaporthe eres]|nr:hypothetical protein LA080_002816 [Diaporthe eres]